jgi:hypothetical protein
LEAQLLRGWGYDEQDGEQFAAEIRARLVRMVLDHEAELPSR